MSELPLEVCFAIAFLIAAPFVWMSERRHARAQKEFLANAAITDGVVSRENIVERHSPSDVGSSEYKARVPIVKYSVNKIEYEFNADNATVGRVGSAVKVAYDPKLPSTAVVVGSKRFRIGCAPMLLAIAIILVILGYTT